jgi:hypothetical protein
MKTPSLDPKKSLAPLIAWAEKSGLKARLEPSLAKFNAMEEEKRKQIITALIFAVIAANLLLVLAPITKRSLDIHQRIQKINSEVQLARKDIALQDHTIKTRSSTDDALAKTTARVFKSDQIHKFLDALSEMARESRVNIESLAPMTVKSRREELPYPLPKGYKLVGYELVGKAGFHELGDLISRLESSDFFVRTESIKIYHELSFDRRIHEVTMRFILIRQE